MCPSPGSSVTPTQFGSAATRARACTGGVIRSSAPTKTAVGTVNSRTPWSRSSRPSTRDQAYRTCRGQACTIRAHASTMTGDEPAPMVPYLRTRIATGVTGPSGARERRIRPVSQVRSRPATSGTTFASATSLELAVLHSRAAAACSLNRARPAVAISAIPPMECPTSTAFSPGASVAARTASRSSASASVPHRALAGLRPCPRWS